jgi:hypothetical protein
MVVTAVAVMAINKAIMDTGTVLAADTAVQNTEQRESTGGDNVHN